MLLDYTAVAELYRKQSIGSKVGLGRSPAVLVIDLTEGFTRPESPIGVDMSSAVENTARLLEAARGNGYPVVYTVNGYRSDLQDAGVWPEKFPSLRHLTLGERWTRIDDRVAPRDQDVVLEKQYPSAFFGTPLPAILTSKGVDSLIITGTTTSGCIRASVVDGVQYGYRVTVAEDCVSDRDEAPHRANLFDIGSKYGDVVPLEELLTQLP